MTSSELPVSLIKNIACNASRSCCCSDINGLCRYVSETSDKSDSKLKRRKYLLKKRVNRKDKGE